VIQQFDIAVQSRYNGGEVMEMAANMTYNIRIDKRVRQQADALFKSMGMSMSTAINLFLTQSVIQGKLPLTEVVSEPAYADAVLQDIAETEKALQDGTAAVYKTPEDLFAAWDREDE
jgi:DNA-damage-inducible protein J